MLYHKNFMNKKVLILFCLLIVSLLGACRNGESNNEVIGWDYFETFNPIGSSYEEITGQYDSLTEDGVYDGGVVIQVNDENLYFGFPRDSMDAINDDDQCVTVYGTLQTVFGISSEYSFDEIEDLLNVTFKEYEGTQTGTASIKSGSYCIQIYTEKTDGYLQPNQGVAVFHNVDNRHGTEDVPDVDVYVDLHSVESSAISSIGYDEEWNILAIEFRDSQELWYYYGVPKDVYEELENADSIGRYYNEFIKGTYKSIEKDT